MAAYKVINLDSPIESDYWVDIPVRDPATNKDTVDEEGRILVQRHVTRSIKNEELSTFNTAVETVNTLKEDYSTFKEDVSTKVNSHDSNILTNTNSITTLTDSVANHDLQINALYTKINAIQGIDIDDFKYVTETDIKNIKKDYLPLAGGTVTGDLVLSGKVSSNSPIKADLQGTADRAIGDINGKALTSYIANLEVSGASITVANGAGKTSNYTVDNINHATHATAADSATNATYATHAGNADTLDGYHHDSFPKVNSALFTVNGLASPGWSAIGTGKGGSCIQVKTTDNTYPSICFHRSGHSHCVLAEYNGQLGTMLEGDGTFNYLITSANIGSQRVNYANGADDAVRAYSLRTNSHADHFLQLNWNGIGQFNCYVLAPDGGTRDVRVAMANIADHATSADSATQSNHLVLTRFIQSDCNNVTNLGVSGVVATEYSVDSANLPSAHWYQMLTLNSSDANYNNQLAFNMNTPGMYYRSRREGSWGSWARLIDSTNIGSYIAQAVPTGSVFFVAFDSTPSGFLLCNGGAVSRTTYSALFAKIGTKYGAGDGYTTFNLPNLIDRFVQGNATAGTYKSAGLPNITGQVSGSDGRAYVANGAFTEAAGMSESKSFGAMYGEQCAHIFSFSASNSNTIYGASATVQPPALTLRPIIKY